MANDEKITITDGEMRVLKAMFANMKSKPDIDWDAAAIDAELGSAKSIKERHRQICVRLGWNNKSGSGGAAAAVRLLLPRPSKGRPRGPEPRLPRS